MKGTLFKPDMIQATIEGKKTQTRRVIKHPAVPNTDIIGFQEFRDIPPHKDKWQPKSGYYALLRCNASQDFQTIYFRCSYCIGETVYIKEKALYWDGGAGGCSNIAYSDDPEISQLLEDNNRLLVARETTNTIAGEPVVGKWQWRSPLFMPEWAARYFLKIKDVRAERLQEITEEDALKEGVKIMAGTHQPTAKNPETGELKLVGQPEPFTARYHYEALWDCINPDYPWESNPWVFRYEFEYQAKENV